MIALFCGSREWTDWAAIEADISQIAAAHPKAIVIHGGQRGADTIAGVLGRQYGLHAAGLRALWSHFGRGAGPLRNEALLRLRPDVVYAYPLGGPGTRGMIDLARAAGVEVVVRSTLARQERITNLEAEEAS